MTNVNLELKKSVIAQAYKNNALSKKQYELIMQELFSEEEEARLQQALKEYRNKDLIEKYLESSHV